MQRYRATAISRMCIRLAPALTLNPNTPTYEVLPLSYLHYHIADVSNMFVPVIEAIDCRILRYDLGICRRVCFHALER